MPGKERYKNRLESNSSKVSIQIQFHSTIRKLIYYFGTSLEGMEKVMDPIEIENLCSIIHQVMVAKYRKYHHINHIFKMVDKSLPHYANMAIIFHDLVYLNVDKRIHPLLAKHLTEFNITPTYTFAIPDFSKNESLQLVAEVFGFNSGNELSPTNGANEFLSAIMVVKLLSNTFNVWELLKILACIEATIPFRAIDQDGLTPSERLANRLYLLVKKYHINVSRAEVQKVVVTTTQVANRDLESFFSMDLAYFLSNTWDLILENNPIFRNPLYTVKQYRGALQKVEGFFKSLDPSKIPAEYAGVDPEGHKLRLQQSKDNLENGISYMEAKLLSTAVLEAVSEETGGDAPISLLIGESPSDSVNLKAPIEYHLDYSIPHVNNDLKLIVNDVLQFGRQTPSGFDFKHSPLSIYLYRRLNQNEFNNLLTIARKMFTGKAAYLEFLNLVPKPLLSTILDAIAEISWTRKKRIADLKVRLSM